MKILLIDNEPAIRDLLRSMIESLAPGKFTIDEAGGVQSGLLKIRHMQPDIVFLDVEMDDGTGFDLMQQIPDPGFQLIFTTAYNQYAIQAFKFSAVDYLLKPVDPGELDRSLSKAQSRLKDKDLSLQLTVLLQEVTKQHAPERKIVLKDIENTYFIRIADINYCEAEGTYTRFHLATGTPILVSRNLKEYESMLEPMGFIRTHHSFLVNPSRIIRFDKTDGGALILEGGTSIPVSQRKKDQVMQTLESRA